MFRTTFQRLRMTSSRVSLSTTKATLPFSFQRALVPITDANILSNRLALSKIVATIGPASEQLPMLEKVVAAGMGIMRINFSHATYEEADLRTNNLNACREADRAPVAGSDGVLTNTRGIMLDTQGPEIRTGSFDGVKEVDLIAGNEVLLTTDESARKKQTASRIWISYNKLGETAKPSSIILLDDGAIQVEVQEYLTNGDLRCKVLNSGTLGNKKGVNMPGLKVKLPAISDKDKTDLVWGIKNNIDYIAASFIRKAGDVHEIRDFCNQTIADLKLTGRSAPLIISKIESTEGLENFAEILDASDAIMVARGDLAVEIPMETLATVQKDIVKLCNDAGKPVIVATQMLESMQKNPRPTRAEITDVSNAILDGADCVMLSGESAKGKYPVNSVAIMRQIVKETELNLAQGVIEYNQNHPSTRSAISNNRNERLADTVKEWHSEKAINGILVDLTSANSDVSRHIALAFSQRKVPLPIFAFVSTYKQARLLQLHKGILPVVAGSNFLGNHNAMVQRARDAYGSENFADTAPFIVVNPASSNIVELI